MLRASTSQAIAQALHLTGVKRQKFNAREVVSDGERFGSEKEFARFRELQRMERVGMIADLRVHPVFLLFSGRQFIGKFTVDSCYRTDGELVAEEVKGEPTRKLADYRLRVKLFKANFPTVRFVEVRR